MRFRSQDYVRTVQGSEWVRARKDAYSIEDMNPFMMLLFSF